MVSNLSGKRLSKFIHPLERNGTVALYRLLDHKVIYLDQNSYRSIKSKMETQMELSKEEAIIAQELINQKFAVPIDYNEFAVMEQLREHLRTPLPEILYLLLSHNCNFKCDYCFIERAMPKGKALKEMAAETAIKAIHLFAKSIKEGNKRVHEPRIIFYGGEPLLNKPVFIIVAEEISRLKNSGELPANTLMFIITNGSLVDDTVIEIIKKHGIYVSVSLDGVKEVHDKHRQYKDGRGTFDDVVKSIKRMQDAGIDLSLSCTVTEDNVGSMQETLEWFSEVFKIKSLGYNMLVDIPERQLTSPSYTATINKGLIECFKLERAQGIYEDRFMRKAKHFVTGKFKFNDCAGCGNQMVIAPDGTIGPCQPFAGSGQFFTGNVQDPGYDPYKNPSLIEWSKRSPINMPDCKDCYAMGLCGGGCVYNAFLKHGTIWKPDESFCLHTKVILEWLVWDLFDRAKVNEGVPSL